MSFLLLLSSMGDFCFSLALKGNISWHEMPDFAGL
jgi:hypothetical protein